MTAEADYLETVAAPRSERAAADGDRCAADPSASDYTRACATRAAETARENAVEYRALAECLRDGEVPDGMDLS